MKVGWTKRTPTFILHAPPLSNYFVVFFAHIYEKNSLKHDCEIRITIESVEVEYLEVKCDAIAMFVFPQALCNNLILVQL